MIKGLEALENLCNQCEFYQFEKGLRPKKCPHNKNCVFRNRIEKELKALEFIKDLFDFDFALRFPTNQPMLRITNKRTKEYWEIPIAQEEYDLLKEVML